jgi:hypothetical protein
MALCDPAKRVTRKRLSRAAYPILRRWCGVAGVLGGVLFVAWGYIDRPHIPKNLMPVIDLFAFVVPTLFLTAVGGLSVQWRSRLGVLGWMGMALTVYGSCWGVVAATIGDDSVWAHFAQRGWAHYLHNWLLVMLTGLTLIGIATIRVKPLRRMGALALAMGVFGWVYYLTDAGAVLEARSAHIGFGVLFGLGWVALGWGSWQGLGEPRIAGARLSSENPSSSR